jgi:hypothetical protein
MAAVRGESLPVKFRRRPFATLASQRALALPLRRQLAPFHDFKRRDAATYRLALAISTPGQWRFGYLQSVQNGNAPGCAMPLPMELIDDVEPTVLLVFEDDVEPTVLLVFEDGSLELAAFVWFLSVSFLSRIVPVRSKHWLKTVALDPEFVPVPCAFAIPAVGMSATPVITPKQILFMIACPLVGR